MIEHAPGDTVRVELFHNNVQVSTFTMPHIGDLPAVVVVDGDRYRTMMPHAAIFTGDDGLPTYHFNVEIVDD